MRGVTRGFWAQASSPAICIPTFVKQHARTLNGGCGGGRCQTKETLPLPDKRRCRERWWWWWRSWWRWWRVHNYTPDPAAVLSLVCVHVRACVVSCVCTSVSLSLTHMPISAVNEVVSNSLQAVCHYVLPSITPLSHPSHLHPRCHKQTLSPFPHVTPPTAMYGLKNSFQRCKLISRGDINTLLKSGFTCHLSPPLVASTTTTHVVYGDNGGQREVGKDQSP